MQRKVVEYIPSLLLCNKLSKDTQLKYTTGSKQRQPTSWQVSPSYGECPSLIRVKPSVTAKYRYTVNIASYHVMAATNMQEQNSPQKLYTVVVTVVIHTNRSATLFNTLRCVFRESTQSLCNWDHAYIRTCMHCCHIHTTEIVLV